MKERNYIAKIDGRKPRRKMPLKERFEKNLSMEPNTGCWLWTGHQYTNRYGQIGVNGSQVRANRLSWELHKGPIPKGLNVLHHCDTPECVNPYHLFLGTAKDNMADCIKKNRLKPRCGITHPRTKLTPEQVSEIRADLRGTRRLSREYGVSRTAIRDIRRGITWKHSC